MKKKRPNNRRNHLLSVDILEGKMIEEAGNEHGFKTKQAAHKAFRLTAVNLFLYDDRNKIIESGFDISLCANCGENLKRDIFYNNGDILNELSLFSGAGGGLLASKYMLGFRTIGYVEWEPCAQAVIFQRIRDGLLDEAPIFNNITSFINQGYARSYQGLVDVITAGFPCQPFSVAGKQLAENDPRNKWPETRHCISVIRPEYALLENVPGLLSKPYIRRIFGDLAEIGYDARWQTISAKETGHCHKRDRAWIMAHSNTLRKS